MSDKPPRPRAFRLDDHRVAVDEGPSPLAPMATIMSQSDAIPLDGDAPLDVVEREVEAAQSAGVAKRRGSSCRRSSGSASAASSRWRSACGSTA